jgi:hypothetical protein
MKTITIDIYQEADISHFRPTADDCAPFEYDLMIDGLDADIVATGRVILKGDVTEEGQDAIAALSWVIGITIV